MAVEVALALVVLMAAALFVRSFSDTLDTDPGFRREGVLLAEYDLYGRNLDDAGGARLHRAAADAAAGAAGRRGGGDREPGAARHSRPVAARLHARGARPQRRRARPRAQQHRHAGLFQDDGDPAASGTRLRAARGHGDAAAGDRQRGVRAALCRRRRAAGTPPGEPRQKLRDRRRRAKLAQRFVRREARAGHLFLLPRSAVGRRTDPPAHAPRQARRCSGPRSSGLCARARSGAAGLRRPHADRSRRQEPVPAPHPGADVRRARTADADAGGDRHLRGRLVLGVAAGRPRSASGWRSAPPRGASSRRSSAKPCASSAPARWPAGC